MGAETLPVRQGVIAGQIERETFVIFMQIQMFAQCPRKTQERQCRLQFASLVRPWNSRLMFRLEHWNQVNQEVDWLNRLTYLEIAMSVIGRDSTS